MFGFTQFLMSKTEIVGATGNMTLWLKNRGLYDRKSTEFSNLAFLLPSHTAPQPLPSADTVEIHCEGSMSDPSNIHISCTQSDLSRDCRPLHLGRTPRQKEAIPIHLSSLARANLQVS